MKTNLFISLFKQTDNGLFAHIYEHAFVMVLEQKLRHEGLFEVLDYTIWAKTYGTTCFVDVRSSSKKIQKIIKKNISALQKQSLTKQSIERAIIECSCEYERPINKQTSLIYKKIQAIHEIRWQNIALFNKDIANTSSSVSTTFDAKSIKYGKQNTSQFQEVTLDFSIKRTLFVDKPELKILAILIVQAISINSMHQLADTFHFYDNGDTWNNGAPQLQYRNFLIFPKDSFEVDVFNQELLKTIKALSKELFIQSILNTITKAYKNDRLHYFELEVLNSITDGTIIGYSGWRSIATKQNILTVLAHLKVKLLV